MSSLLLKEIEASDPDDQTILELFTSCREHVIRVSATHFLPHQIAVTTKNGFIELVNTASGEFRLFLTFLDRIPLDASLRCFSLVPSLYAASTTRHQHHLLFSLAYSNELLLGNVETSAVRTLATCVSRPSVVECDGDYIVCGEGNGQLSVWRGSAEERERVRGSGAGNISLPPLLWQQKLFDDSVVCIGLHRDQLVCCSADYRCVVASVEGGTVRATLSSLDIDRGVAAFALTTPPLMAGHKVLAVCLTSRISVFAVQPSDGGEAGKAAAAGPLSVLSSPSGRSEHWSYRGGCRLSEGEELTCASCLGAYMAAGTRSGLVLLYACDAAAQQVKELVRFNVGYGVKGMQLFADDTLLVVTSAGDVWRWPLADLLSTVKQNAGGSVRDARSSENDVTEAEGEEEEPVPSVDAPPQPSAAPGLKTAAHPAQLSTTLCEVSHTHEGEAEDRNLSLQESSSITQETPYEKKTDTEAGSAAASVEDNTAVTPSRDRNNEAEGDSLTSVHLSSLHRDDDTADLNVSADDDDDDVHGERHDEDSLGTDGQPTEPTTALCLDAAPLGPALARQNSEVAEGRGAVNPHSQDRPPAVLYDPETVADTDGTTTDSMQHEAAMGSVEVSHCDSAGGVSPPSSADTTAHIEATAHGVSEQTSPLPKLPSLSKQEKYSNAYVGAHGASSDDIKGPTTNSSVEKDRVAEESMRESTPAPPKSIKSPKTRASEEAREMAQLEAEFDQAVARMLGPKTSIEGLRRGRRMDPRKVAGILHNLAKQHAGASAAHSTTSALAGLNSTKLLEEKRAAIAAAAFDFDAYRQAHRLEVDALQYQHPVKALTYTLQDRVFGGVEAVARLRGAEDNDGDASAPRKVPSSSLSQDELRDVTYGRVKRVIDAEIVEERRRGGPELRHHRCEDLLFPSPAAASTVLFKEDALLPSTAWEEVLLLPMPLPPASSVF
ncbi:suppressive immunomodulating factor putative (TSIF) [Leptomonas pyrrhocoris]|uniref:Suppressive immunomodulating factor putative (TSIF) n=1 Tax=Leptomonas pyrrhocoris TaxID=157538 RepID=A0A0M9FRM2_LEPPY|nr:suppressive immunomodulating factor putative (TSIF) [Leptomonas pyrrhocoris]KPA74645.1 suppressive immunomodulating factor putative (TSIF) [Leptomonas pyrrhocoris]|eukprot:XP_015653084.1 suppressive immunomodulating factor putative (TSIF) [Leptomonas pyrrhocoris]